MKRLNVMVAFGTRPEAIKMAPVVEALRRHPDRLRPVVTLSGQHREMLDQVLSVFDIVPDHDLDVMAPGQSLAEVAAAVICGLDRLLAEEAVDLLLVQGDTTTTFAAGLAAFYRRIPVGHIEAGLRTHDPSRPFPEEMNRRLTARLSAVHFAPTERAKANLLAEGVAEPSVVVTGNTVIDAMLAVMTKHPIGHDASAGDAKTILVTAHRRESLGKPLEAICLALLDLVDRHDDMRIVFPVHGNPRVREIVCGRLSGRDRIALVPPLDYPELCRQMAGAHLILTDSGGIQEEAPTLGKPVLVLRNETERQEGVDAGTCRLVGTDRQRIVEAVDRLLGDPAEYSAMARAVNPYGDGKAAERIVRYVLEHF